MTFVLVTASLLGCQTAREMPSTPQAPPVAIETQNAQRIPAEAVEPLPAIRETPSDEDAPIGLAEGAPCAEDPQCASNICEGIGCDDASLGTCAPITRPCTRDRRPFCGCDGETFFTSSTCPGQRFVHKGLCADDPLDPPLPAR